MKLGPGSWAGGSSSTQGGPGRTWEEEGCQLPPRGRAPPGTHLGFPGKQEQGVLCPGMLLCTPGSALHPRVLPAPQALPCTSGCSPTPQGVSCTPGSALHSGLSPALWLFPWQDFPSSKLSSSKRAPQAPPHLHSGCPRLVLATQWHDIPVTLGTPAVQGIAEGLVDGETSPPTNPCPPLPAR